MIATSVASHKSCRSMSLSSVTRSTTAFGLRIGRSGVPGEEIGEETQAVRLALLGMELGPGHVVPAHDGRNGRAVRNGCEALSGIGALQRVGMAEIEVRARIQAGEQRAERKSTSPNSSQQCATRLPD